jgi:transcriptional regulator with XRE-family HTH domain
VNKVKTERAYALIGTLLRQRRNQAGLPQVEVAESVGITRSHLSRIESGTKRISIVRLLKICEVLGTDGGQLISEVKMRLDSEGVSLV